MSISSHPRRNIARRNQADINNLSRSVASMPWRHRRGRHPRHTRSGTTAAEACSPAAALAAPINARREEWPMNWGASIGGIRQNINQRRIKCRRGALQIL